MDPTGFRELNPRAIGAFRTEIMEPIEPISGPLVDI
jgi:hypothetical protein